MLPIDQLCYSSNLRNVNTEEKMAFSLLTLLICVISRMVTIAIIALLVNSIMTVIIGKTPMRYYKKMMIIPLAFLILSTIAIIINISPIPLDAYAIPIGKYYLTSSRESLRLAFQLIITALAAVSCLYFLALSTPLTHIMVVLEKIKCPRVLIELMILIYRFIFILFSVASAIQISQQSRLGYHNYRTSIKSFSGLGSVLFIIAIKRANAVFNSMESRGYDGRINVISEEYPPRIKEIILLISSQALLISVWIWSGNI